MAKDLNYYFNNLPECLRKEIFSNIIPESRNIKFHKFYFFTLYYCKKLHIKIIFLKSSEIPSLD